MASLPPRKTATPAKATKPTASPLQILLQMGFPKHRAERALAATGERGVQLASDWLLAHVNDLSLDVNMPREYILYACPTGPLLDQLQQMWTKSLVQCGRNGAHNYLPHVTLCSFFKAPDDSVSYLAKALTDVVSKFRDEIPEQLKLTHYTSPSFIGLFVAEDHSEILKKLAVHYVKEVANYTAVEPYMKSLHVTLAYQFPAHQYTILDQLSRGIDCDSSASWDVRLYSRDNRIASKEVHKVLYSHIPSEADELELLIGDYVYVDGEQLNNTTDGWVEGTSWLTGSTGFLPATYIEKTAESDAWTLHKSVSLTKNTDDATGDIMSPLKVKTMLGPQDDSPSPSKQKHSSKGDKTADDGEEVYAKVNKPKKDKSGSNAPRKLIVCRHAERVDFTFGAWIPFCFDSAGVYTRRDLNMPKTVPPRKGGPQDFFKDCPLTEIGLRQASLLGEALGDTDFDVSHVYCSPSLRCVQTCTNVLAGMGLSHLPICIEPGLFEWLAWYQDSMPEWMSVQELKDYGYNIELNYRSYITAEELYDRRESSEQYFMRSYYVSQSVIKSTADKGGNILLVGHAATLDTCTRQLCRRDPRGAIELAKLVHKIPYCSMAIAEERESGSWELVAPPFPPITHSNNMRFDWKVLAT